ncbi:MAG: hypothetical protein PHE21_01165 [Candidatus Dojkabacteria bacterium]|nr:hypothetical protein [Candidatus Dojkabacteria bacterium]
MLKDSNKKNARSISISTIQRYIFFILLLILPFSIIPFPWDWTEKSMSLVILIFSTIIIALECIKLIWDGKTTYIKSILDKGSLVILVSMILSTILSKDVGSSIWGIDNRLGSGLVIFVSMLLLTFCARSFIRNARDIKLSLIFLLGGIFITNTLSLFSFLGVNIWSGIPVFRELHQVGLPLLGSAKLHILVNVINILICIFFMVEHMIRKGNGLYLALSIIFLTTSIINVWVYSINHGISLLIVMTVILVLIWIFGVNFLKIEKKQKINIMLLFIGLIILISIPIVLLHIPSFRAVLIPENIELVTQVSLGNDISWVIASSVLMTSLGRALFGLGVDTYTIAYNLYKPLNKSLVAFNQVNFYSAGNEILTKVSSNGFIWVVAWIFFGFLLFRTLVNDIKKIKEYDSETNSWMLLIIDFTLILIFISSIFITYTVIIFFIIFLLITLHIIVKDSLVRGTTDRFALKLSTMNVTYKSQTEKSLRNINILITVVLCIIFSSVLFVLGKKVVSSAYLLKAESYILEQNKKYIDGRVPTFDERNVFVDSLSHFYSTAAKYDAQDSLANRKTGMIYLEKLGLLAEMYNYSENDNEKKTLLNDASKWRNYTLEFTGESIKRNPYVYANWDSRYRAFLGLISMGYNDYFNDAEDAIEKGIELNPNNFELYYSKAQIQILLNNNIKAQESLIKVLSINPQHVPSLVLMGRINKDYGNIDIYESYLKAAKKVLESIGSTDTDEYKQISSELLDIPREESQEEEIVVE